MKERDEILESNCSNHNTKILVYSADKDFLETASLLASKLSLEQVDKLPQNTDCVILNVDANGLALISDGVVLRADFTKMLPRIKPNNLNSELVVKAAKIKSYGDSPIVIDATAGFGEDSFLLAAAGFNVKLYEYNPIIAELLSDAMIRAKQIPELAETVGRMEAICKDSIVEMRKLSFTPDLILLDPMFPSRQKSALVKKKFQLLQLLEMPCTNEKELLQSAVCANPKKIIIKRPAKGPYLSNIKPSYSIEGKSIRYDCIVT